MILALALTVAAMAPTSVMGAESGPTLSARMADGRRALETLQAEMRADDAAVAALRKELATTRRDLKDLRARRQRLVKDRAEVQQIIAQLEAQIPHGPAPVPGDPGPVPGDPAQTGLQDALIEQQARLERLDRAVATLARQGHVRVARIRHLVAAGKAAEAVASDAARSLWGQIEEVTGLAELRAVQLAGGPLDDTTPLPYQWPTKPRITQADGCTGFGLEPARGDCEHFHDGVDLGPGYGAVRGHGKVPADGHEEVPTLDLISEPG